MASGIYNKWKANVMNKELDMEADVIKVILLNNTHTFTATDNLLTDVNANEVSGTGYTAGGVTLANKSITQAASTKFDADDSEWTTATFTAYHAVIYSGTDLIASLDFGGAQTISAATFTIVWNASGILTLA